ncbi:MAG: ExbD/TolR family protein [Candidatus Azotimanducaceae bacterium]|uniref:Biopolymer transporter ExbD n=1 Tax=OM182 bacterium TaxID=2510334 RepID=A0A520S098_9GAMM|nr:biopolymer transporter ExbD [Gammaproteobacteria bacterium]RZO75891.1 MAG: biopolymer transporter ExbD [OM182 bacterium]
MKFSRQKRDTSEINLTPLIDVVFLLLIFFMVSTTFSKEARIVIDLPESGTDQSQRAEEEIEISITKKGSMAVNQKIVLNLKLETLVVAINKVSDEDNTLPLIITADAETPHQFVVMAMDAAAQLGFARLKISTKNVTP